MLSWNRCKICVWNSLLWWTFASQCGLNSVNVAMEYHHYSNKYECLVPFWNVNFDSTGFGGAGWKHNWAHYVYTVNFSDERFYENVSTRASITQMRSNAKRLFVKWNHHIHLLPFSANVHQISMCTAHILIFLFKNYLNHLLYWDIVLESNIF